MGKIKNFLKNSKGKYRVAFTVCILILSGFVVTVTENKQSVEAPVSVGNEMDEAEIIPQVEVDNAIRGLSENGETTVVDSMVENEADTEEIFEDVSFSVPVYGKILKPFSNDVPLYSKTMDDWRIHEGVDIACYWGTEVYCAQDGTISDTGYDINLGNYITVKNGEYEVKYASLSTDINFEIGDKVSKGQLLGTVADSAVSEICDEPHFHFEIKLNGEYVNPADYILFE